MKFTAHLDTTKAMREATRIARAQERVQGFPLSDAEYARLFRWVCRYTAPPAVEPVPAAAVEVTR